MSKRCRQCNKELPANWSTDICLDCSKVNVRKIFKEHPDVKQAFQETIQELNTPENRKKMADDTVKFMQALQRLQKK